MKTILVILLIIINIQAINIGTILSNKEDKMSIQLAKNIQIILEKYDINLNINTEDNSYSSINKLLNNKNDNFFAIVKKEVIQKYNQDNVNKNIYNQIPAILSLGSDKIHIFKNENNDIDFFTQKTFKVYCGKENSEACISTRYIQKAYNYNLTYIKTSKDIFKDLNNNKFDLYISVTSDTNKQYKNLANVDLVDLPTNFNMEDMYLHGKILSSSYSFLSEDIHAFLSSRVLVTNLKDKKYDSLIKNILKIIMYNRKYLVLNENKYWQDIDFYNFFYKKFSKNAKSIIEILEDDIKQKDALIF